MHDSDIIVLNNSRFTKPPTGREPLTPEAIRAMAKAANKRVLDGEKQIKEALNKNKIIV